MAVSAAGFAAEIERAGVLAAAQASGEPAVVALEDRLRENQIYLGIGEVFSVDLVENAFVSPDGVDLRGPLVLHNLRVAVNLCNWLDTDTIVRTCWALNPQLAGELDQVAEFPVRDRAWVKSVFDRLTRENPPVSSVAELQARYERHQPVRMLSTAPANQWLLPAGQLALRLWFITRIARDYTAMGLKLDEVWWQTANEKSPISRAEFARVFAVDLSGVGRAERGWAGLGGNFFADLGRSVSRLFRHPLRFFRSALEELGKGLMLVAKPLEWLEKLPYGHLLAAIAGGGAFAYFLTKLNGEFGRALVEGSLSAFKEQELAFDAASMMWQVGTLLMLVGAVIGVIPCGFCQALGATLAAIGALMVAIGQGMLAVMRALRQQRLAAQLRVPLPVPQAPAQQANRAGNASAAGAAAGSGGGAGAGLFGLLILAALGAR